MTRSLTLYQGADMDPSWDYSDWVEWPDCEFGTRCNNGEATQGELRVRDVLAETGSALNLPGGLTYRGISAHNVMTLTEDASGVEKHIWRGWVIPKDYSRGAQKSYRAREIRVAVEDLNAELRGIIVGRDGPEVRPVETDVARVSWLLATYFDGSVRASTVIGDAYVPSTNTVTMPAKDYEDATPEDVLRDCGTSADKRFWVILNDDGSLDLFYDVIDSAAYASTLEIRQTGDPSEIDNITTFEPIWDAGPASREDGQQLLSGLKLRGPGNISAYSTDPTTETEYNHFEEVLYDDLIATQPEAEGKADAILLFRQYEDRTYSCSIMVPADRIHLIRPGMNITIQAKAIPDADDQVVTRRIGQLKLRVYNNDLYKVTLQLDRPLRVQPYGSGDKALTTMPHHPDACDPSCVETFSRSADPGWGDSEINDEAHTGNAIYNVNGSEGGARQTGAAGPTPMNLPVVASLPFEILIKRKFIKHVDPTPMTGNYISVLNWLNNTGSYLDAVGVQLSWEVVSNDLSVHLNSTAGSTPLGVVLTDYTSGTWFWMRFRATSTNLYVKTWYAGTPEPAAWSATTGTAAISPEYLGWGIYTFHADADMEFRDDWYQVVAGMECEGNCPQPGTVVGTGDGAFGDDTGFYLPPGSALEHSSITTGGPYHELTQLSDVDLATPPDDDDVLTFDAPSGTWKPVAPSAGHAENHATRHADGGADEVAVEGLPTAETDTALVLHPDGTGGIVWGTDEGGGGAGMAGELVTDTIIGDGVAATFALSDTPTGSWALVSTNGADLLPTEYAIVAGDIVFDVAPVNLAEVLVTFIAGGFTVPATDPSDIVDPTLAAAEDVALKLNALMANLRIAGIIV